MSLSKPPTAKSFVLTMDFKLRYHGILTVKNLIKTESPRVRACMTFFDANNILRFFFCLGSLAAFVYQHSITPLALPIRLTMPSHGKLIFSDQISNSPELRTGLCIDSLNRN